MILTIYYSVSNNWSSFHHQLKYFSTQLVAIFNSYHYTVTSIQSQHYISLLFPRQLLTLCKCGLDTMAPVECIKWVASTWYCTLIHACVRWAPRLTMDCSGIRVFTVELLWTIFYKLMPPPTPPSILTFCPPSPLATLAKIGAQLKTT